MPRQHSRDDYDDRDALERGRSRGYAEDVGQGGWFGDREGHSEIGRRGGEMRHERAMTRGLGGHSPANATHHRKGVDFPAQKEDFLRCAEENGAGDDVLEVVRSLPDGDFETMADVMKTHGEADRATGPETGR